MVLRYNNILVFNVITRTDSGSKEITGSSGVIMQFELIVTSVAKWLAHLPFTSEAAGSNLTEYFLNATRTQSSCEKSKSQRSAESRGFSPGIPVSSHRES